MPISHEVLWERFYSKAIKGDPQLELELTSALADKDDKFLPRDMGTLRRIMEEHCGRTGVTLAAVTTAGMLDSQNAAIEKDTFDLMMKKMAYDVQAYKVWLGKLNNYEHAVQAQKLDWARQARTQNSEAASAFISQNMNLRALTSAEDISRSYNTFAAQIEGKLQLEQGSAVTALAS